MRHDHQSTYMRLVLKNIKIWMTVLEKTPLTYQKSTAIANKIFEYSIQE